MSHMISVTGSLSYEDSGEVPPVSYVLATLISGNGATKDIASLSQEDGSWHIYLGSYADYEIEVRSTGDNRALLQKFPISVAGEHVKNVRIILQNPHA